MPLSETEKANLENDGKFTREMINYFDSTDLSYNKIKELQSVLEEQDRIEELGEPSINDVNSNVYNIIRSIYEGLVNRNQGRINMNNEIEQVIVDIRADIRADIRRLQSGNFGGRRSRSRRSRRSRSRRSKSRSKRGKKSKRRRTKK